MKRVILLGMSALFVLTSCGSGNFAKEKEKIEDILNEEKIEFEYNEADASDKSNFIGAMSEINIDLEPKEIKNYGIFDLDGEYEIFIIEVDNKEVIKNIESLLTVEDGCVLGNVIIGYEGWGFPSEVKEICK